MRFTNGSSLTRFFLAIITILTLQQTALAAGKRIDILLKDGRVISNVLLVSVQDTVLIVETPGRRAETAGLDSALRRVTISEVEYVTVRGKGFAPRWTAAGALAGVGLGVIIGHASANGDNSLSRVNSAGKATELGLAGGAIGGLVGLIFDLNAREPDRTFTPLPFEDFSVLKQYTEEPLPDDISKTE